MFVYLQFSFSNRRRKKPKIPSRFPFGLRFFFCLFIQSSDFFLYLSKIHNRKRQVQVLCPFPMEMNETFWLKWQKSSRIHFFTMTQSLTHFLWMLTLMLVTCTTNTQQNVAIITPCQYMKTNAHFIEIVFAIYWFRSGTFNSSATEYCVQILCIFTRKRNTLHFTKNWETDFGHTKN